MVPQLPSKSVPASSHFSPRDNATQTLHPRLKPILGLLSHLVADTMATIISLLAADRLLHLLGHVEMVLQRRERLRREILQVRIHSAIGFLLKRGDVFLVVLHHVLGVSLVEV